MTTRVGLAEDTVMVRRASGDGQSRRVGTIREFTGEALLLELSSGRVEQIPTASVVGYETTLAPGQQNGDQLFAEDRFAEAVVSYGRAVETERRAWMRRIMLAQMARCYANMGQIDRAGRTFRLVVQSDPTTQLLDALPLTWVADQPSAELLEQAARWLEAQGEPATQLMGASWLLSTNRGGEAIDTLKRLADSANSRVAQLAQAQLWRRELVTVSSDQTRRWADLVRSWDESLVAGPYYLVGQAWARHGQHSAAALALLRVPILYPQHEGLAGEALFAAGQQLEKMGDSKSARSVYAELVRTCTNHRLAPLAQQRLERAAID
jgi:tetratricopeptide (TPR) repeat protein